MAKYYTPTKLSENIRETPEGFLLCLSVPIARTGWMEYGKDETPLEAGDDGLVHIYRDPKEVFRTQTMASFEGKSLTIRHPNDFVSPENWSYLSKGILQNIRKSKEKDEDGEESLLSDILITDAQAIQLVKAGLREVSCGYEAEYEQTEVGKGRQTNIVGNHLALVEQGRAGSSYAINDEKRKGSMSKMIEKLKAKFGAKVVDEAMAEGKEGEGYDELVKACKDLMAKVEGMSKPNDEKEEPKKEEKPNDEEKEEKPKDEEKEEKSEDDDAEEMKMEERLKAVEAAVAKLLEKKAGDEDKEEKSEDDEEDVTESGDEEGEEGEESQKKAKAKSGDKKKTGLEGTKNVQSFGEFDNKSEVMTADKMNELNAAHWARK